MDFLKITDITPETLHQLIEKATKYRKNPKKHPKTLKEHNIGLFFEEYSTRTRVSLSVAVSELGGTPHMLNKHELQITRGEEIGDTAAVLSRYLDGLTARMLDQKALKEFAEKSEMPIINAMTKKHHPCQTLADLQTIKEKKGKLKNLKYTWIGDTNNVCNSAILGNAMTGIKTTIATPKKYQPNKEILNEAQQYNPDITITEDPIQAVKNADIIYTDVWISTGMEKEAEQRKKDFKGYQVTKNLIKHAKKDAIIMHCMPIDGKEITRQVVESPNSVIIDQAENRLHSSKALLNHIYQ
ncbi:Ornithine carbamoyltransferase ArgF [Methanonatronarchaeum thermophilum]|uniref:Ornithine carbamoyltransferase n=1 Tax=Methanonatronarchaeum thermophilum TaxID=1927129 RepID=A0A1Y3GFN3_9EURY|nr:ornithine carbamoyltransferase [Methanonatronarchaeum thermophilum]OUJ18186.1 Ornithine carbamoyltransferase ArgF [Methanonatronarchaeum thermophilum]